MKVRNGQGKWLMRETLYRHVPKSMIDRPKQRLRCPPGTSGCAANSLRDWAEDLLSESRLKREGYFPCCPHPAKMAGAPQRHPQLAFLFVGHPDVPGVASGEQEVICLR
jgi:asparagine synthase (glutamine-hydrolysing)